MGAFVLTSATVLTGTAWTGTAPGPGNPTVSGTITSSVDRSDHVRSVSFGPKLKMEDFTTFGDGGFVVQKPGLMSADLSIEFNQDFASSQIDAVFSVGHVAGTLFYLDIKATNASRSATNPSFVCAAYVTEPTPISGAVGDRASYNVSFAVTGTFARLTS